jgi:hypothetical protein
MLFRCFVNYVLDEFDKCFLLDNKVRTLRVFCANFRKHIFQSYYKRNNLLQREVFYPRTKKREQVLL